MKENVEALKICIAGWHKDLEYAKNIPDVPDASIETKLITANGIVPQHNCRLCELYCDEEAYCSDLCPVKNDTSRHWCDGSPYENVPSARMALTSYFAGVQIRTRDIGRQLTLRHKEYLARNKKLLITYTEIEIAYLERLLAEEEEKDNETT